MELNIIKEKEVPLLDRKRVTVTITQTEGKTPSRLAVKKAVAKKLKVKEETVVVRHIYSKFGSPISKAITHIYKNEDAKKKFEQESLLKKHEGEEKIEAPKEEAVPAPEAKVEEKPVEDTPKEEAPATEEKTEDAAPAEKPKEE